MLKAPHLFRMRFAALFLLIFCVSSCDKVADIIKNGLSFDISKTSTAPLPANTPAGQTYSTTIPVGVTNSDLTDKSTTTSLVKTVRLTAMKFRTEDASFAMTNFDTLRLSLTNDGGASELVLGTYVGKSNSYNLNDTNFVSLFKDSKTRFKVMMKLNTSPSKTINVLADYTFSFTADPL